MISIKRKLQLIVCEFCGYKEPQLIWKIKFFKWVFGIADIYCPACAYYNIKSKY